MKLQTLLGKWAFLNFKVFNSRRKCVPAVFLWSHTSSLWPIRTFPAQITPVGLRREELGKPSFWYPVVPHIHAFYTGQAGK